MPPLSPWSWAPHCSAIADGVVAPVDVVLYRAVRDRQADVRAALDDVVGHHDIPGDDLDPQELQRAVVGADHVPPDGRLVAPVHAQPVVDDVVLDERAGAAAPDLDPQPLACRSRSRGCCG